jgi:predicted porin
MKKTLIALAAFAATASFAQSSVTISGIVDVAYGSVSGSATTANSKKDTLNASIGSATSAINFNIVEDLGGGLKAQGFYAIDPRAIINDPAAAFGRHESYVGLSGGFGNIRMGSVNTASLQANGAASVFGTATGSQYTATQLAAGGATRFANSVRYDTPNFSGFGVSVTHTPGNDDATSGGALAATTDLGVSYSKGALNVNFSSLSRTATAAQAAVTTTATAIGTAAVAATAKSTYNMIGANYTMGSLRLLAGYGKGDKSAKGDLDSELTRLGASYTMGKMALHAGYTTLEVGTAAKATTTGVRADYALSPRTTAYAGYETLDSGATSANKTNTGFVGVRHNF